MQSELRVGILRLPKNLAKPGAWPTGGLRDHGSVKDKVSTTFQKLGVSEKTLSFIVVACKDTGSALTAGYRQREYLCAPPLKNQVAHQQNINITLLQFHFTNE